MQFGPSSPTSISNGNQTTPLPALPLAKEDVPVVYAELLRATFERRDVGDTKTALRAEYGCSPKALDGVHAQLTKDIEAAFKSTPEAPQWADPASFMRLTAYHYRTRGASEEQEPPEGYAQFLDRFGQLCHQRGVGMLWEEMTGNQFRWATVVDAPTPTGYRGAAHADFDFPAKIQWRGEWERFLKEKFDALGPEKVAQMKVLCFPSKDPRRELSIYLRLGIRPENIVGVEGDKEAAAELDRNLKILGGPYAKVNLVASDLLAFLRRTPLAFDVISLDFHGCFGYDKSEIYRLLRPTPTHYVLVNLEAAREKHLGQRLLREQHLNRQDPLNIFRLTAQKLGGTSAEALGDSHRARLDKLELSETREEVAPLLSLGNGHWTERSSLAPLLRRFEDQFNRHGPFFKYAYPHMVTPQAELDAFVREAGVVLANVYHEMLWETFSKRFTPEVIASELYSQYQVVAFRHPALWDLRRYEYKSEASEVGQRYLSSFAEFRPRAPTSSHTWSVADFLTRYAVGNYELTISRPDTKTFGGICCLERTSRNGHRLFQAWRHDEAGNPTPEGPVISSASIKEAICGLNERDLPFEEREAELCQKPRVTLAGARHGTEPERRP